MPWVVPEFSKTRIDKAGRQFVKPDTPPHERAEALEIINNWRSAHSFPLNTFQVTLRTRGRRVDSNVLIAQRLKRLTSITAKLRRLDFRLTQLQDIGGCRAVVNDLAGVDALTQLYLQSRSGHTLVRQDDYIRDSPGPQPTGYRSMHFVYRYEGVAKYSGLQIEVQLRSRMQHAWATAVETVGMFTGQALKAQQGSVDWLRFFALIGSEMALVEHAPPVPGTPTDRSELREELRYYVRDLDVIHRLQHYGEALKATQALPSPRRPRRAQYYLLELDALSSTLAVHAYGSDQLAEASRDYERIELATQGEPSKDVVLVRVDSIEALTRAYPNYYGDTRAFISYVRAAVLGE